MRPLVQFGSPPPSRTVTQPDFGASEALLPDKDFFHFIDTVDIGLFCLTKWLEMTCVL